MQMDRSKIISVIRQNSIKMKPLPNPFKGTGKKSGIHLINIFKESLKQVGGDCLEVNGSVKLNLFLDKHYPSATNFSRKEEWKKYSHSTSKGKLNQLGTVILKGQFGVAENGAIWLDDSNYPNRLIPFIAERLIICLNSEQIFSDMHEAYSFLGNNTKGFGVFISGPSKTADIEQNLVYGAHGAVKLEVILY